MHWTTWSGHAPVITLTSGAILETKPFIMCAIGSVSAMSSKNPKVDANWNHKLLLYYVKSDIWSCAQLIFSQRKLWQLARWSTSYFIMWVLCVSTSSTCWQPAATVCPWEPYWVNNIPLRPVTLAVSVTLWRKLWSMVIPASSAASWWCSRSVAAGGQFCKEWLRYFHSFWLHLFYLYFQGGV